MSAARLVRVTVELPAGRVLADGLARAVGDLAIESDGTIRTERPHPMRLGELVGTWALVDEALIP